MHRHTSLLRKIMLLIGVALACPAGAAAQQDTMETTLDAVTITAGTLPVQLRNVTRSVEIVDAKEIRTAAPTSLDDVLRSHTGAFVQRRGPYGTQSDLSLRGGTFGQTLVMLDGMRINDPQTGHHALQIPLPLSMIERIEILPGHGSALLGADAMGGAVNFVTAPGRGTRFGGPHFGGSVEGGSFGLRRGAADAAWGGEVLPSRTAVEYRASDGWRAGTEFSSLALSHLSRIETGGGQLSLFAAYADRDFGAFDFYSPGRSIPSQERVRSGFAALSGRRSFGRVDVRAALSYRDLRDRFQFDRRIPDRFINEHHTQVFGARLRALAELGTHLMLSAGAEASSDRIRSSNLGDHERSWLSFSTAAQWRASEWIDVDAGLRWDAHDAFAPQVNPTLGLLLHPVDHWTLRASIGRSFRLPTYTDLFYSDPVTRGNAALRPERAWSAEAGVEWRPSAGAAASLTAFRRDQLDMIDYVQQSPDDLFLAMNFTSAVVEGVEARLRLRAATPAALDAAELSLSLLENRIDTRGAHRTRYAMAAPSRLLRLRLGGTLPGALAWGIVLIAADQQIARDYASIDLHLRRAIGFVSLYLAADNLANSAIEEFPGLPLPGRWLRAGVEIGLIDSN